MKWGLVAASLSDMNRPVEDLSVAQCSGTLITLLFNILFNRIYFHITNTEYIYLASFINQPALALTGIVWSKFINFFHI